MQPILSDVDAVNFKLLTLAGSNYLYFGLEVGLG
jgi:hypothetical protein